MTPDKMHNTTAHAAPPEGTVPKPRVPEQDITETAETGHELSIDFERAAKIRVILIKVEIKLRALQLQLENFDKQNDVPDYNQKALAGDNPIIFSQRQALLAEMGRYEALRAKLIAESI